PKETSLIETHRAVCAVDLGNPEAWDRFDEPSGFTANVVEFVFKGHLVQDSADPSLDISRIRLAIRSRRAKEPSGCQCRRQVVCSHFDSCQLLKIEGQRCDAGGAIRFG